MILLNGMEGGGQLLRTALALSTLTGQPFRMTNIRAKREQPGLKAQHLTCILALKELCNAKTDGAELGSTELLYIPGEMTSKSLDADIGTAGSITLLLQAILLPCTLAKKPRKLTITGGTDVPWSMPIDYFTHVLIPHYKRYADIKVKLLKRGYYPKGGGTIELTIKPAHTSTPFNLITKEPLITIKGISHASKDLATARVAERQAQEAEKHLRQYKANITAEYSDTPSTGSGITLWAVHGKEETNFLKNIGADALGEQGKQAELVGKEAAEKLLLELSRNAPVDRHLADNLVPLMAVCAPSSITTTEITEHTKTNIEVAEAFYPNVTFTIKENTITTKRA